MSRPQEIQKSNVAAPLDVAWQQYFSLDASTVLADGLILNKPLLANGFWLPPSRSSSERIWCSRTIYGVRKCGHDCSIQNRMSDALIPTERRRRAHRLVLLVTRQNGSLSRTPTSSSLASSSFAGSSPQRAKTRSTLRSRSSGYATVGCCTCYT
jgi:hypothetical protein